MSRVYVRQPLMTDQAEFLETVRKSSALHAAWVSPPATAEQFGLYLEKRHAINSAAFLICHAASDEIVGVVNVTNIILGAFCSAYLGYYAFAGYERQGLMQEGLLSVMAHARDKLGLHRLEANIQPDNAPSIALVKKCGFSLEGYSPQYLKIHGQWRDHERWAVILSAN
ncbi:GNAT family N-acetyltransferase [Methylobacillus methanolivorans]|uniref:GNAT family N-acetyltransferase n=1 Tax=Methylobacillus methanolivorans TaxID=1848927 RepID=A0ABW8GK78_9PROT